MSDEDDERIASDDETFRTPAQRSFHHVLHIAGFSHGCDHGWIDDYGWDRIPRALLAAGWTPPAGEPPMTTDLPVPEASRDAVETVYNLGMNGGVGDAYAHARAIAAPIVAAELRRLADEASASVAVPVTTLCRWAQTLDDAGRLGDPDRVTDTEREIRSVLAAARGPR